MHEQPYTLSRLRCNELIRDCNGREFMSELVMVPARDLLALILEVKSYRKDPRDRLNELIVRQTAAQRAKDKAGVK